MTTLDVPVREVRLGVLIELLIALLVRLLPQYMAV